MGSTRLPGKVLKNINGTSILEILINRIKLSKKISNIIVATTYLKEDKPIYKFCKSNKIDVFCGSKNNLIKRYFDVSKKYSAKHIVRITGDCPLVDHNILDKIIDIYFNKKLDYCSNTCPPKLSMYPDGSDIEIFNFSSLKKIYNLKLSKEYKEHLTMFFWKSNKFKRYIIKNNTNLSKYKYSVDTANDFNRFKKIFNYFKERIHKIRTNEIISYLKK